jgi:hypothetical protein
VSWSAEVWHSSVEGHGPCPWVITVHPWPWSAEEGARLPRPLPGSRGQRFWVIIVGSPALS